MELYPVCDESFETSPNIWYVLSGDGELPQMRVGHCMIHMKNTNTKDDDDKGKLYIIGGANPSGCFNDMYTFDLNKLNWTKLNETSNLPLSRYEHACFTDSTSNAMYIFGGSCENGNLNDTLEYKSDKWVQLLDTSLGKVPSSRTQHVGCVFRNQLVVFGGGEAGSNAVNDKNVYVFSANDKKWSTLCIKSGTQQPAIRHGHLLVNFMDKYIYLHGGMHESNIYDDLWILNMDELMWSKVSQKNKPCARAAHGGICTNKYIYIYGGLSENQSALDDFWKFNVDSTEWSKVNIHGDNPPSRLDYAFCKVKLNIPQRSTSAVKEQVTNETTTNTGARDIINVFDAFDVSGANNKFVVNSQSVVVVDEEKTSPPETDFEKLKLNDDVVNKEDSIELVYDEKEFFIIHGGMDTLGNIFDDCFIFELPD